MTVTSLLAIANNLPKRVRHTPSTAPQARQLHDLTMIHEQIHIHPKLPNVPVKHLWIGRLEHETFHRELLEDTLDGVRPRSIHILRDPFTLDHNTLHPSIQEFLPEVYDFRHVARPCRFQLLGLRVAARAKLNSEFGFRYQPITLYFFDQSQPVVWREGEKACGELYNVEAARCREFLLCVMTVCLPQVFAFLQVPVDDHGCICLC